MAIQEVGDWCRTRKIDKKHAKVWNKKRLGSTPIIHHKKWSGQKVRETPTFYVVKCLKRSNSILTDEENFYSKATLLRGFVNRLDSWK